MTAVLKQAESSSIGGTGERAYWRWTLWLVAVVTLARALYLMWGSNYTLIEDEAHYWEWSRRLDWSYYTKGPGVGWTIAASTWLFGVHEWAIRLPAVASAGLCMYLVALLARDAFGSARAAFLTLCCMLATPLFQTLGLMMTIDSPYAACWALAMVGAQRALGARMSIGEGQLARAVPAWWLVVGLAVGAGCLYKYTMLLALPGMALAAWRLARSRWRIRQEVEATERSPKAGLWLVGAALLFGVAVSPIVVWNVREGWPTVAHLLGHLGVAGGDMPVTQGAKQSFHYDPWWTVEFAGTQLALVGPVLVVVAMMVRKGPVRNRREAASAGVAAVAAQRGPWMFLLDNGVPILAFYTLVSFVTQPEGNWPMAGYVTLLPIAGRGLDLYYQRSRAVAQATGGAFARWLRLMWHLAVAMGVVVAVALPRLDLISRLPLIGRMVPIHRFAGADLMAGHTQRLLDELTAAGSRDPFVVALHYGRAGQLAYYLPGRPTVYCASSLLLNGRRTQYDYWEDTDLRGREELAGRDAVVVGGTREAWLELFARVEEVGTLDGDGKKGRPAFLAFGWKKMVGAGATTR